MRTGRRHRLSIVAHAIDDGGALCGVAKPERGWTANLLIPVNCPRCLVALSTPRYALCESPGPQGARLHVRVVGPEGLGGSRGGRALCGAVIGWDIEVVRDPTSERLAGACPTCLSSLRRITVVAA